MECKPEFQQDRKKEMMAVHDAMDVLNGKWKIYIGRKLSERIKLALAGRLHVFGHGMDLQM